MSQFIQSLYSSKFSSIDVDSICETKDLKNTAKFSSREVQSILTETKEEATLSTFIFKNLLHLSRKEQLSSIPQSKVQKKSEVISLQISKLKNSKSPKKRSNSSFKVDPSLISKLKYFNTYEEIKALGSSEDLLQENCELRKQVEEIERKEFIKRQVYKLAAKEINSDNFKVK
jgi:hypothetical protein